MSEERKELKLQPCPFCGADGFQGGSWLETMPACCGNTDCRIYGIWMPTVMWNSRPAEERLEAALRNIYKSAYLWVRQSVNYHNARHDAQRAEIERLRDALRDTPCQCHHYNSPFNSKKILCPRCAALTSTQGDGK